jgi:hypothetical protein
MDSQLSWIITVCKKWSRSIGKHCNGSLQQERMCPSMCIYPLWHGLNGPMAVFLEITVFLAILERHSNDQDTSNGHIASPWRSPILRGSTISTRFKFLKPASYEVFSGTYYSFCNFAFFILRFLAFFPVI